jgi:DNA polymerase V
MRQQFGVVMERTVAELQGISCLALEEVSPPRKQIVSSRAFRQMVSTLRELREPVSTYMQRGLEKSCGQTALCAARRRLHPDQPVPATG